MSWFKTLWRELVGLFVDDAAFAAGILAVLVVVWLGASVLHLPSAWMGGTLFAGLAVLLLQSTWTQSAGKAGTAPVSSASALPGGEAELAQ